MDRPQKNKRQDRQPLPPGEIFHDLREVMNSSAAKKDAVSLQSTNLATNMDAPKALELSSKKAKQRETDRAQPAVITEATPKIDTLPMPFSSSTNEETSSLATQHQVNQALPTTNSILGTGFQVMPALQYFVGSIAGHAQAGSTFDAPSSVLFSPPAFGGRSQMMPELMLVNQGANHWRGEPNDAPANATQPRCKLQLRTAKEENQDAIQTLTKRCYFSASSDPQLVQTGTIARLLLLTISAQDAAWMLQSVDNHTGQEYTRTRRSRTRNIHNLL